MRGSRPRVSILHRGSPPPLDTAVPKIRVRRGGGDVSTKRRKTQPRESVISIIAPRERNRTRKIFIFCSAVNDESNRGNADSSSSSRAPCYHRSPLIPATTPPSPFALSLPVIPPINRRTHLFGYRCNRSLSLSLSRSLADRPPIASRERVNRTAAGALPPVGLGATIYYYYYCCCCCCCCYYRHHTGTRACVMTISNFAVMILPASTIRKPSSYQFTDQTRQALREMVSPRISK